MQGGSVTKRIDVDTYTVHQAVAAKGGTYAKVRIYVLRNR